MKQLRWFHLILLIFCGAIQALSQDIDKIIVEPLNPGSNSEIIRVLESNRWIATNGVIVHYSTNFVLIADRITLDETAGTLLAEGNVSLQYEGLFWRGERLHYNYLLRQLEAEQFRVGSPPFYASGESLLLNRSNQTYTAINSVLTTDNVADPAFSIRSKKLVISPGKSATAQQASVRIGNLPVMYFPTYTRHLNRHPNHVLLTPGYRTLYGPYLLGKYHWFWTTNLSGAFNVDFRQKRGFGFGPEVEYDFGRWGRGQATAYYTHDDKPGFDPLRQPIDDERYRIKFAHQATLRTNLTATLLINKQSEAQVIRDFFESEYREDPQPKSFLELNQLWSNFSLSLIAQPQLNDFFQSVERLPDLKLSGFRQQIGASPFFYESDSSLGYYRFQPVESSITNDYSAMRGDTFHQILLPKTFFGWLNFVPRVGGRFTHYGETESDGTVRGEQDRGVFNTGAELSAKASRVWNQARSPLLDIAGLRHIVEPSINYVFVPDPSRAPRELPQFDYELQSLRLLPIDYPDYNSIDSIDSQNVLRLSLHNKLQTKRADGIDNLVNWGLYTDWRIDPRSDQETFADLFSDLDLKPRSWLILSSEIRYNLDQSNIRIAKHTTSIVPNDVWALSLGHWYVREDPAFGLQSENNLIHSSLYYRFNENWAARVTHHYEARDGVLEEQYYTLYRDLRSWTSALTLRFRDHRFGQDDFTIALTFSLKAFPRYGLGRDRPKHSLLLGS